MSKLVPWDSIPDNIGNVLPTGTYKLEIEDMQEVQSSKGRYMLKATFRVLEPTVSAGMVLFDNFAIGNEADPNGDDPKSWEGIAAARWKDVVKKAAVPQRPTVEETCMAAKGQVFLADVVQEEDKSETQYKGQIRNRVKKTFRVGEKQVDGAGVGTKPTGTPAFRPGMKSV